MIRIYAEEYLKNFLYNLDPEGLKRILVSYMNLPEIQAIRVVDYKNQPFLGLWKAGNIRSEAAIPENVRLNDHLSMSVDSYYEKEQVGRLQIYYSNALVTERLAQNKDNAKQDVSAFQKITDLRLNKAIITQISLVIFIIIAAYRNNCSLSARCCDSTDCQDFREYEVRH